MKTLYEDSSIKVYENGSGEIFITCKRGYNHTIRVTPRYDTLHISASSNSHLIPTSDNGVSAFTLVKGN
jgi:hypothetical protein